MTIWIGPAPFVRLSSKDSSTQVAATTDSPIARISSTCARMANRILCFSDRSSSPSGVSIRQLHSIDGGLGFPMKRSMNSVVLAIGGGWMLFSSLLIVSCVYMCVCVLFVVRGNGCVIAFPPCPSPLFIPLSLERGEDRFKSIDEELDPARKEGCAKGYIPSKGCSGARERFPESSKTNVRPRWCIRSNCERMGMARLFAVEGKGSQMGTDAPFDRQICAKVGIRKH